MFYEGRVILFIFTLSIIMCIMGGSYNPSEWNAFTKCVMIIIIGLISYDIYEDWIEEKKKKNKKAK
jgi:peptidoglycan/LPS O-acetylase OafA/YrhL